MFEIINVIQAKEMIASGKAVLIDVRDPEEFKMEHIALACSVPLGCLDDIMKTINMPEDKAIIFQCQKGMRGEKACIAYSSEDRNRNKIYNMTGGIEEWKKTGLPVVGSTIKQTISLFRQVQIIVGFLIALFVVLGFTVHPNLAWVAGFFGVALFFAGITGWCGLAMVLQKMSWNK